MNRFFKKKLTLIYLDQKSKIDIFGFWFTSDDFPVVLVVYVNTLHRQTSAKLIQSMDKNYQDGTHVIARKNRII